MSSGPLLMVAGHHDSVRALCVGANDGRVNLGAMKLTEVDVRALTPERLEFVIGPDRASRFERVARGARELLQGRAVLNVNSTAAGGGVAEMLQTLLAYARGVGIDARWVVIRGNPAFFDVTKQLHNNLYGSRGSDVPLGSTARRVYEETLHENTAELLALVRAGDVVVLHDPQTAGLADALARAGAHVVWRCHVGIETSNEHSDRGWNFLRPYLEQVSAFVFSRPQFAPAWVAHDQLFVIPPSIDPFSAKNEEMDRVDVLRTLQYVGLLDGGGHQPLATFTRRDGSHPVASTVTSTFCRRVRRHRSMRRSSFKHHVGTR